MPVSISATINVDAAQLQGLQDIPKLIQTLVDSTRHTLESVREGEASGNPLGALFSTLGELGKASQQLPSFDAVLGPLQQVTGALPDRALADVTVIRGAVGDALGIFGPTKDLVLSGKLEQAIEEGVGRVLDVAKSRLKPGEEVGSMFGELEEFFRLFRSLIEWRSSPPNAEQAADFLSRVLIGVPRDLLSKPVQLVDAALRPLEHLLPASPDLTKWRNAPADRVAFWAGIDARLSSGAAIDWPKLEADLRAESRLMLDLRAARDRLLSETIIALGSVRLNGLSDVAPAVTAVPKIPDFRLSNLLQGLKLQLEGAAADLEAWAPTPDELRALVRRLGEGLRNFLEQSPLGQLRNLMLDFQHRLLLAIESLPFAGLARKAEEFLRGIALAIDSLDAAALTRPIHEFFSNIENQIQTSATGAVRDSVGALWQSVEDVFTQINTQLTTLRETLEGLVGNLKTLLDQLQPALQAITESVNRIKVLLDEFDILEAADLVVDELHKLRDKVAALDYSKLPGPALSGLHAGADFLRGLDIAGAVNPPLNDELKKIDPTPLLQKASVTIGGALDQLKQFDPQAIVTLLDKPVDELLVVLRDFGPDRLKALIGEALKPVEDAVRSLDASKLLAPVSRLFQELTARVDSVLNPDVIFAPLEKLFQPVVDLIDAIEPGRLIGLVAPHADKVGETVGSAAGPPPVMQSAGASLKQAISASPESNEPLFGFRPGDLLLPLIDLYRKFREVFDPLDSTVVEPATRLLREAFHLGLQALQPQTISLRAETALAGIASDFDPSEVSGRFTGAIDAYHAAARKLGAAARGNLQAGDAAVAVNIRGLLPDLNPLALVPEPSQVQGVATASASVRATIDLGSLRSAIPGLNGVQKFFPAFLATAEGGVGGLRQMIDDLDPARLRTQINEIFDRIGRRIVALQEPLMAGIDEFMGAIEDFLLPISPGHVIELAQRLHAALKEQIVAFSPATFKDEIKLIFDAVKAKLAVFDPALIAGDLNGLRDALIETLRGMVEELLPDMAPFVDLQERVAALKPSRILLPAVEALKPVSDLIAKLDVEIVFQPLIDALDRVRLDLPEVVSRIEGALDEVLAAIPEGGPASASASASVSIG